MIWGRRIFIAIAIVVGKLRFKVVDFEFDVGFCGLIDLSIPPFLKWRDQREKGREGREEREKSGV